ncbi:MAG: beta-lactamase family protein [Candidatus Aminicenantes bacterium]|nr:beta-lactamase family protein [Candidatus Aminicenantes bacterium]
MTYRFKLRSAAFLIFLCLWNASSFFALQEEAPDLSPYAQAIQAIDKFVVEQMAHDNTPGLSVGFLKDDFSWTHAFGYADLENLVPANPQSSYRMASITKTFTAIAVLQLVEAGKMDLDAEIQTCVPYFPPKKWPITIRQLLGHLGGIPHYVNRETELHIKDYKNTKEAIAIFQDYDLVAEPGTQYHYSSYGYNLLGAAIEEASGQPYGQYIKEHIFDPLGMTDSRMDDPTAIIPHRVRGYRLTNGTFMNSDYVNMSSRFAAGGTRSTVIDLLKYAKGIIDGKLLSKKTWRLMLEPMANRAGLLTGKGLCWDVRPWRGHFQISHGGSQQETRTFVVIFPLEKFAIALASNLESFDRELYVQRIAEIILGEDLATPVYVSDEQEELLYTACEQVFSYGLSQYYRHNGPITQDANDIKESFSYFNQNVNLAALRRNPESTRSKISSGIHPAAKQAFTKAGSFMALVLEKTFGREKLRSYHKTGPIAFFSDYVQLAQTWDSSEADFKLSKRFTELLSQWEKDWGKVYTDDIRHFHIPFDADLEDLQLKLKQSFMGAPLYPDFHQDMIRIAEYHVQKAEPQKAFLLLNLAKELYPNRTDSLASLAALHVWAGNKQEARICFQKTFAKNPKHPGVSIGRFESLSHSLINAKKYDRLPILAEIATELYPKSWELSRNLGDTFFHIGQKERALEYYKRAVKLNPRYKEGQQKINILEREIKK